MYKKVLLTTLLLLSSTSYANSINQTIDNSVNKAIDTLPESMKGKAEEFVNDVKTDGKNVNFFFNLESYQIGRHTADSIRDDDDIRISENPQSRQFITAGIMFLPNTWKVNISYSALISTNSIYFWPDHDEINDEFKRDYSGQSYHIKDEDKSNFFEIYMKPLSTSYGDIGFGYKLTETVEEFLIINGTKLIDRPDPDVGEGLVLLGVEKTKYLIDFDNKQNNWKRLFGFKYEYETSNGLQFKNYDNREVIHKPDTSSHIFSLGYSKTFDEIKSGFDIKELYMGYMISTHEYYNYLTSKDESIDDSGINMSADFIYMFKPRKDKKFYTSFKAKVDRGDYMQSFGFTLKLGMIF